MGRGAAWVAATGAGSATCWYVRLPARCTHRDQQTAESACYIAAARWHPSTAATQSSLSCCSSLVPSGYQLCHHKNKTCRAMNQ